MGGHVSFSMFVSLFMPSSGIWFDILCGISKFSVITNVSVCVSAFDFSVYNP